MTGNWLSGGGPALMPWFRFLARFYGKSPALSQEEPALELGKLSVKTLIIAYKLPKPKRWCGLGANDLFLPFGMLAY